MKTSRKTGLGLAFLAVAGLAGISGAELLERQSATPAEQNRVTSSDHQLATIEDLSGVFRSVAQAVEPSVVNINITRKVARQSAPFNQQQLRRFFRNNDGSMPELPPEMESPSQSFQEIGTGSGVIMEVANGTGYVLTNNHVAGNADEITVTLADGRTIKNGKLLGADPNTDLAVVEIKADNLTAAHWGDSNKLQQGDWVMAFGSPFGYVGSMTHGIVSALHRQAGILGQYGYENFIQVDAPINPGNSGGPLVNVRGEVVGINTAIASRSGGFQGIGFAIPSSQAREVYPILKEKGKIVRGWLGVEIGDVSKLADEARSTGYTGTNGVLVKGVLRNTPSSGKLEPGDVITEMNGKKVEDVQELRSAIAFTQPGTTVKLGVVRNGKDETVEVPVGAQPSGPTMMTNRSGGGREEAAPVLGMRLSDLSSSQARQLGINGKTGALVTEVDPSSPAAQAGISRGDLITRIGAQDVRGAADANQLLSKADLKKGVRVFVTNRDGTRFVLLQDSGTGE